MNQSNSVEAAAAVVRKMWEKHGIQSPLRFIGFCLSLLPVPGIQQAGQAIEKHLQDKEYSKELALIWQEITRLSALAEKAETVEDSIKVIAQTVNGDADLKARTIKFLALSDSSNREFTVLTENNSFQRIVNSLIEVDVASFVARSGSSNTIEKSVVNAQVTKLHATDGSHNFVDGTTFRGPQGSVGMHGITTRGSISASNSSIGFGPGSSITFGGNPNLVKGNCPHCNHLLQIDRNQLVGYTSIRCPKCARDVPFVMPN